MMDNIISIENLIEEGKALKSSLKNDGFSNWYFFENEDSYTTWKFTSIRHIEDLFRNDIGIERFKKTFEDFERYCRTPEYFSQILGVLESYKAIPRTITLPATNDQPAIQINNSQSQNQEQTQSLQIIVDGIKDELKGSQLKELKEIIQSDQDEETKKKSIKDKFISFGQDVASNILANIISNPLTWGALF